MIREGINSKISLRSLLRWLGIRRYCDSAWQKIGINRQTEITSRLCGVIGRHASFRSLCASVRVRVPSKAYAKIA